MDQLVLQIHMYRLIAKKRAFNIFNKVVEREGSRGSMEENTRIEEQFVVFF